MGRKSKEVSIIAFELKRFENQIREIQDSLESILLADIEDIEERLRAIEKKTVVMLKLPTLLSALKELRTEDVLKAENIRGNKSISPLEDGSLDD